MDKTCARCGETKALEDFHKSNRRFGYCKVCNREYNFEYRKNYYKKNKEKLNEASKKHMREMRIRDPVRSRKYSFEYAHRSEVIKRKNEWFRNRNSTPKGKLENRIVSAINIALKGKKSGRHWEQLVGYTLEDLANHLESLFSDEMGWDNMGLWHIDHIKPRSLFNYTDPEDKDFKKCWALENLQPLWAEDNLRKAAKVA